MKGVLEYKSTKGPIKDLDMKKRIVTGYLSAFGNKDKTDDIMVQGAFTKTLHERKEQIYFLNQHQWAQPHGKFNVLNEDQKGLYFESTPLVDTTYSSDLLKLYEAGIINEHSIGYTTIKSSKDYKGIRSLKEVKLYEGSNVTIGANSETPILGLKGMKEANDRIKILMKAIRNGTFTNDTFTLLEIALKQIQAEAIEIERKTLKEPGNPIPNKEPILIIKSFINSLN